MIELCDAALESVGRDGPAAACAARATKIGFGIALDATKFRFVVAYRFPSPRDTLRSTRMSFAVCSQRTPPANPTPQKVIRDGAPVSFDARSLDAQVRLRSRRPRRDGVPRRAPFARADALGHRRGVVRNRTVRGRRLLRPASPASVGGRAADVVFGAVRRFFAGTDVRRLALGLFVRLGRRHVFRVVQSMRRHGAPARVVLRPAPRHDEFRRAPVRAGAAGRLRDPRRRRVHFSPRGRLEENTKPVLTDFLRRSTAESRPQVPTLETQARTDFIY